MVAARRPDMSYPSRVLPSPRLRPLAELSFVVIDNLSAIVLNGRIVGLFDLVVGFIAANGIGDAILTSQAAHRQPAGFHIAIHPSS